jgi:prepilin-type N-terminal cleavage/methylation domain-containing protein
MFRKVFESEEGFTLVELLVTIAILAVLFGIVTLTLAGVGTDAEDSLEIAECAIVQSAADIWLAVSTSNTITARTGAATIDDTVNFADAYMRDLPTAYTYEWDADGTIYCAALGESKPAP